VLDGAACLLDHRHFPSISSAYQFRGGRGFVKDNL
jgi:hypothetical protein